MGKRVRVNKQSTAATPVVSKKKSIIPNAKEAAAKLPDGLKPSEFSKYQLSRVEQWHLEKSGRKLIYPPTEKVPVIEVGSFPTLGRLTALRFIEWVQENPEGVISLPTGKTPEYFIKWVRFFLENWDDAQHQALFSEIGMDLKRPQMKGLYFVQIDEFYPIDPAQHNSFFYYVNKHYLRGFGLDPQRAMLINPGVIGLAPGRSLQDIFPDDKVDLSLRARNPLTPLEAMQQEVIHAVDQFCCDYEDRIRSMGGLGFFLGGIGPDGHIGFNARGSHLYSPTRLTQTNYETEAAAASDLGGIEVSRNRPVITIGLGTITYNPKAVVLIFAAGDAKSRVVANAIQNERCTLYPASVLHQMPYARFYLTTGASSMLCERRIDDVLKAEAIDPENLERSVIDYATQCGCRLDALQAFDCLNTSENAVLKHLLRRTERSLKDAAGWVRERLLWKIERGLDDLENASILHTGPHHDDIMLGYMPHVMHLVRRASNTNSFYILTSGFTAVTNAFLAELLMDVRGFIHSGAFAEDAATNALELDRKHERAAEVYRFLDGIAMRDDQMRRLAQARRTLVNLISLYEDEDLDNIAQRIAENLNYLETLYPGKKDIALIQRLKGMQREYEEELIWGYVGANPDQVYHARLGFYTGDIFTEQPTHTRDVAPVLDLLMQLKPTILTLAFDPEGSGPDTHYKVLQVLHDALLEYHRLTGAAPVVWGYRNVWYRFHPAEANIYIPATLNTMAVAEHSFMHCFGSQRSASFPSYDYDGPFCYLAQKIWVEQFHMIKQCLGERFFIENPHPRLRATRGFVFLKGMDLNEFSGKARSLAKITEASF